MTQKTPLAVAVRLVNTTSNTENDETFPLVMLTHPLGMFTLVFSDDCR